MISNREFERYMPEAHDHLRQRPSLWSYTRLDGWLLLLLFLLCGFGLFVLYSASGQIWGMSPAKRYVCVRALW